MTELNYYNYFGLTDDLRAPLYYVLCCKIEDMKFINTMEGLNWEKSYVLCAFFYAYYLFPALLAEVFWIKIGLWRFQKNFEQVHLLKMF